MMNAITRIAGIMTLAILSLGVASTANAQATRTWISGVGDDVNPCSRTAPCKTFAGAISKTAAGGEIDCLDPGGFGAVTITKAMTLDCGGGMSGQAGGILSSGTTGVIVNAGAADRIVIRNLTISGAGTGVHGIRFIAGGSLTVEHVTISNVGASVGSGIDFRPAANGSKLFMRDVEVQNNLLVGITISPTLGIVATALLENVSSTGNGSNGLLVTEGGLVTVSNSRFAGNGSKGVFAKSSSTVAEVNLDNVVCAHNAGQGVVTQGAGATVRLSNSGIYGNGIGLQSVAGGAIVSFMNNRNIGNATDGAPTTTSLLQ